MGILDIPKVMTNSEVVMVIGDFSIGDVVRLKSGSASMSIWKVCTREGIIYVEFFNPAGKIQKEEFYPEQLVKMSA